MEKLSRTATERSEKERLALLGDLSFFDELEKTEFEEDRKLAASRIRLREKELETLYNISTASSIQTKRVTGKHVYTIL